MTQHRQPAVATQPTTAPHRSPEPKALQAYRDELYGFLYRRVRDAAVAEDLVQDVLVKAYLQQRTLKQPAKLRSWLYQMTRHTLIDYFRLHKSWEPLPDNLTETDPEDEQRAEHSLAQCLVPLLAALPEPYSAALRLAELEGAKHQQVASQLGLSLSGAKSRVQRGRKLLRDMVLQCCRVELDRRGGVVDYEPTPTCGCCLEGRQA